MTLFAFRLIFALDSVLASYKAMMIAEGDDSESDNLEVNDGTYLRVTLIFKFWEFQKSVGFLLEFWKMIFGKLVSDFL